MVLVPEVVDAVAPTPVLAAGGIGNGRQIAAAMALGVALPSSRSCRFLPCSAAR